MKRNIILVLVSVLILTGLFAFARTTTTDLGLVLPTWDEEDPEYDILVDLIANWNILEALANNPLEFDTGEQLEDRAGAMFTGNTETGITMTYQDADGTIDAVIGADKIVESMLKFVDTPADEDIATYEATTGDFEWHTPSQIITAGNAIAWDGTTLNVTLQTEVDSVVAAITGIVKSDGSTIAAATANTDYEPALTNEASLYTTLSDVADFVQADEVNSIDSGMYTDASIDHEHLAPDVISGLPDVTSEDLDYILIWDVTDSALKKCDMGEVRGAGGGASTFLELTDTPAAYDDGKYAKSTAAGIVFDIPAGSGETNTASNIGGQIEIYKQKSTYDLEFRTLKANSDKIILKVNDPIDIGSVSIGDGTPYSVADRTAIKKGNPSNATGTITSIELWGDTNLIGIKVATFEQVSEDHFTARDVVSLGTLLSSVGKKTFTMDSSVNPIALSVETGDYIGIYCSTGTIKNSSSGDGAWYNPGDDTACTDKFFDSSGSAYDISLYGTGLTIDLDYITIGIQEENIPLDTLGSPTDITTLDASTTAHGLLPKLPNEVTHFLDGTGVWAALASGDIPTLNQDTTGNAATVTFVDNDSTNENNQLLFAGNAAESGNCVVESDSDLHYNPSTGTLTATVHSGAGGGLTVLGSAYSIDTTFEAGLRNGIVSGVTVTDVSGINISWTEGVAYVDGSMFVVNADASEDIADNDITYLYVLKDNATMQKSVTEPTTGVVGEFALVCILHTYGTDIHEKFDFPLMAGAMRYNMWKFLDDITPTATVGGCDVAIDTDATLANDFTVATGTYYTDVFELNTIASIMYSSTATHDGNGLTAYYHATSSWTSAAGDGVVFTHWDDGTDLDTTTANKWYTGWIFVEDGDTIIYVYPQTEHANEQAALDEGITYPPNHEGIILPTAKFIFRHGVSAFGTNSYFIDIRPFFGYVSGGTNAQMIYQTVTGDTGSTTATASDDSIAIVGAGIAEVAVTADTVTITATEVDGSITNELNIITTPDAEATEGTAITFADTGIMTITEAADTITFDATEVDSVVAAITGIVKSDGTTIAAAGMTDFVEQTAWRVFYSNADGDIVELALGTDGTYLESNGAAAAPTFTVPGGGGDALTTDPLSQFAATTSLQLIGVMSDETGTDKLVYNTSPTFVTPLLGTPTSGVVTNLTGAFTGVTSILNAALVFGRDADNTIDFGTDDHIIFKTAGATGMEVDSTGELDMNANTVGFTLQAVTGSDTTTTIDWKLGNKFKFTFGAMNETLTFTAPTNPCTLMLTIIQDATGSRTVTWPETVKWPGGTEGVLTTTANARDKVALDWDGSQYDAVISLDFK